VASEKRQRGGSIKESTLANIIGAVSPIVIQIVTVPIYLRTIGNERYGLLSIVWLLLGYFGLFDFGFGRAIASRLAALHDADPKQREAIFWSGTILSTATGLAGALLLFVVGRTIFSDMFHLTGEMGDEATAALPYIAATLPMATAISALSGTLQGRHSFVRMNLAQTLGMVLYQVLPLVIALEISTNLSWLVLGALVGRGLTALMMLRFCLTDVPASPRPYLVRAEIPSLMRYGGWVTVTGIVSPILTMFDRFMIGATNGMTAVAAYTVPYNIVSRASILPGALQNALFPRFAMAADEDATLLMSRGANFIAWSLTPVAVGGILLIDPFLDLWVGRGLIDQARWVGPLLFLGLWINGVAYVPFSFLQARGRPDTPAKFHLLELVLYLPTLWGLAKIGGADGAALAWTLRVALDTILLLRVTRLLPSLWDNRVNLVIMVAALAWLAFAGRFGPFDIVGRVLLMVGCAGWSWATMPAEVRDVVVPGLARRFRARE
jgi:O-antigen/teichoic acid export membrane protein